MLSIDIDEELKRVYIGVSDNISKSEMNEFIDEYKKFVRTIQPRDYRLILEVSEFHIESEQQLRDAVMMFFRTGFRRIYIVDAENYVVKNLRLSRFERRVFFNNITIVQNPDKIP